MMFERYSDQEFENTLRVSSPIGHDARTHLALIAELYERVKELEARLDED